MANFRDNSVAENNLTFAYTIIIFIDRTSIVHYRARVSLARMCKQGPNRTRRTA